MQSYTRCISSLQAPCKPVSVTDMKILVFIIHPKTRSEYWCLRIIILVAARADYDFHYEAKNDYSGRKCGQRFLSIVNHYLPMFYCEWGWNAKDFLTYPTKLVIHPVYSRKNTQVVKFFTRKKVIKVDSISIPKLHYVIEQNWSLWIFYYYHTPKK